MLRESTLTIFKFNKSNLLKHPPGSILGPHILGVSNKSQKRWASKILGSAPDGLQVCSQMGCSKSPLGFESKHGKWPPAASVRPTNGCRGGPPAGESTTERPREGPSVGFPNRGTSGFVGGEGRI